MGRLYQGGLIVAISVVAGMLLPALASAAVLCVNKVGPQCDQLYPANQIQAAITAANLNQASFDKIEIGPGEYPYGPYNVSSNIEIEGSGMDETVLTHAAPLPFAGILMLAGFGDPVVRDLTLRVGEGGIGSRGLQVSGGATVERVRIDALQNANVAPAFDAFGVTARNLEVLAHPEGVAVSGGGLIEDSVISGGLGIFWNNGTARRLRLSGNTGALMTGTSRIENSLVQVAGPDSVGVAEDTASFSDVTVSHVTVLGDGLPGSIGIRAVKDFSSLLGATTVSMEIRNTVVSGFQFALARKGFTGSTAPGCFPTCEMSQKMTVSWSLLDGPIDERGGPGELTLGDGVQQGASPRWMNPGAGDFRPRFDSPLIDAGEPVGLEAGAFYQNESPLTIDGQLRIVNGRRDIGAFEYGRRAPSAALSLSTRRVFLYRPVTFGIEATDPDGDPLKYELNLGEAMRKGGMGGSKQNLSFAFTRPGRKTVKLTVSDPAGLASLASETVQVVARKGRCANRRVGGKGRDRFVGSSAGDRLLGLAGNDALLGGAGADCLLGGPGADRIVGGPGPDRVWGGPGNDRIDVRGGGRDIVDCGPGRRDRVLADFRDRLRNCELVTRR